MSITHIVMAQHDSFRVASCSRGKDEGAALIGPKTVNHSIQLLVRHVFSLLHELCPLHIWRDHGEKCVQTQTKM